MIEATIPVGNADELVLLLGASDQHLRRIRDSVPAKISARDGKIHVSGDEQAVLQATEIIEQIKNYGRPRRRAVARAGVAHHQAGDRRADERPHRPPVDVRQAGRIIRPRTPGQAEYVEAIRTNDLVFCSGPAGTGKTYLAVATAVESLKQKQIGKIVLVRPAVEAGENLGFLPGDMQAKINPYLRPLLRRAARDDGLRAGQAVHGRRRDRSRAAGVHARPHAQQRVHHHGRGTEHDRAADENVSDADGSAVEGRRFGRHVASRPAAAHQERPDRRDRPAAAHRGLRQRGAWRSDDIVRHRLVQEIVRAYEEGSKKKR